MTKQVSRKPHRKSLRLLDVADMFGDEMKAMEWLAEQRWQGTPYCPHCSSTNVQCWIKHPSQTHRCRDCPSRKMFSIKTGTVMESSNLSYREWAIGIYLFTTNLKGISSIKLHRELGIGQKAAWFMLQRLRKAYELEVGVLARPGEVDETYMGRREQNKHRSKKLRSERRTVGKAAVVGIKDRDRNQVMVPVVDSANKKNLHRFVEGNTDDNAQVYTDDVSTYRGMHRRHESVNHSVDEYVREQAHTNGVKSFWTLIKRGFQGIYHKISPKHLKRYVAEFSARQNARDGDIINQIAVIVAGMEGKKLTYGHLTADNGLSSGARS